MNLNICLRYSLIESIETWQGNIDKAPSSSDPPSQTIICRKMRCHGEAGEGKIFNCAT